MLRVGTRSARTRSRRLSLHPRGLPFGVEEGCDRPVLPMRSRPRPGRASHGSTAEPDRCLPRHGRQHQARPRAPALAHPNTREEGPETPAQVCVGPGLTGRFDLSGGVAPLPFTRSLEVAFLRSQQRGAEVVQVLGLQRESESLTAAHTGFYSTVRVRRFTHCHASKVEGASAHPGTSTPHTRDTHCRAGSSRLRCDSDPDCS